MLAASDAPQVVFALNAELLWIRDHLANDTTRPALDAWVSRIYRPRLESLGYRVIACGDAASALRTRTAAVASGRARRSALMSTTVGQAAAGSHIVVPEGGAKIVPGEPTPDNPIIPYIEGDGIGVDITPVMKAVVDAAVAKAYGGAREIRHPHHGALSKAIDQRAQQQRAQRTREHVGHEQPSHLERRRLQHERGEPCDREPAQHRAEVRDDLGPQDAPEIGADPGAVILRSDVERKVLFSVTETEKLPAEAYEREVSAKIYAALAEKARRVIAAGHAAIVDAVFAHSHERAAIANSL